ncbi:MAG: hypothetical protein FVQ81_18325 [Candidatus Glassbacteria bacterium]|nr:hypothetical protein [Candidatus Glassbacteria bacterium]
MTVNYEVEEIKDALSVQRVIFRITELDEEGQSIGGRNNEQIIAEAIIGSPEDRALGSPGDLRFRQDIAQIWQKASGVRTVTGWQLIGGVGAFGSPVTVRGADNLEGTSTDLVRADHRHRLEVEAADDGLLIGARPEINFTGSGVVVTDDDPNDRVNVAIASTTGIIEQIDIQPTDLDVVNTAVETDVYNFTIPAGKMGATDSARFRMVADYLNDTGVGRTLAFIVRLGGTIVYRENTTPSFPAAPARRAFWFQYAFVNRDVTNAQIGGGNYFMSTAAAPATGLGDFVDLSATQTFGAPAIVSATSAIDMTLAQTFRVSIIHSVASTFLSFRRRCAFLDVSQV